MLEISKEVARRFVLGRQGVWPGKRWQGREGVDQAIRAIEAVQVDTISVIARNHDLVLRSRVEGYHSGWLEHLLYTERQFFEYGGILFIYPINELPYWKAIMGRPTRWRENIMREYAHIVEHVHESITRQGPMASRDFKDRDRVSGGFNTVKDTTHALDYLWITGQLMIHSRRGNDRVYDLAERLHQAEFPPVSLEEAELFFVTKALSDLGLASSSELARRSRNLLHRAAPPGEMARWLKMLVEDGVACQVKVEDRKETLYYPASAAETLRLLDQGQIPREWQPLKMTTCEEVNLLAPLDNIIWDRPRLKTLFDYDYVWEVYKPAPVRRWGYYTLPILYGDRLVARLDPKLDRKTGFLTLNGFWLDDLGLAEDESFAGALAAGLQNFARFHRAKTFDTSAITYPVLQRRLANLALE
ncbi:MAG TPA: crosslink repair DNA glycosylase YcaQ family protein [Chloroflexia bacterium]|nr:crosslink repair DNA glycosylase YcaQ family protein [Chloroflexia bacterium]